MSIITAYDNTAFTTFTEPCGNHFPIILKPAGERLAIKLNYCFYLILIYLLCSLSEQIHYNTLDLPNRTLTSLCLRIRAKL